MKIPTVYLSLILYLSCGQSQEYNDSKKSVNQDSNKLVYQNGRLTQIEDSTVGKIKRWVNLLETVDFKFHASYTQVPLPVRKFLSNNSNDSFSIADPGQAWQATDVIINRLPARQLVYAGSNDSISMILYHTGGIGKALNLVIIKYNTENVLDFWTTKTLAYLNNKDDVIKFLKDYVKDNNVPKN